MVAGFTDYAGRGAYIFNNLKDVRLCQESKKAMDTYIHHRDCLQFMNRVMVPFHSHDAIAELGLPLASNDLQQEVFPNYFHVHASFSVGDPESPDFIDKEHRHYMTRINVIFAIYLDHPNRNFLVAADVNMFSTVEGK